MIYLDSAATTLQKPPSVSRAVADAIRRMASPGRGGHQPAALAAETVYRCREEAASLFDVPSPENVVFTSNATHGLNIAIHSLVGPGDTVLISGYEHNAVTRPLNAIPGVTIKVARSALFSPGEFLENVRRELTPDVKCVVMTHVSNVFGYILPIEEIARLCAQREVPLVVDASQSAGSLPISLKGWNAAFVAMPGHKGLYGPQGTGLLLCGSEGKPLLHGGTGSASVLQQMPEYLPDRLEAGTHNVCGIAGLMEGIRYVRKRGSAAILKRERDLMERTCKMLAGIRRIALFRASEPGCQAGVVSFLVDGMDCETVGEQLAKRGIAVRAGLHCAPYAHTTAGTLETGTVRVSFSDFNGPGDVRALADALAQILKV